MNSSASQFDIASETQFIHSNRSARSPQPSYFKFNMFNNSLSSELTKQSMQEQKLKEYTEDFQRDRRRYHNVKQSMKQKFFKIKTTRQIRQPKLQKPLVQPLQNNKQWVQYERIQTPSLFLSQSRTKPLGKIQFNKSISNVLEASLQLALSSNPRVKSKVRTKSQLDRKHNKEVDEQKALIMKFVKKNSAAQFIQQKKWSDLSNKDKYIMDFSDYIRKKTKSAIQHDIYERKIKKKSNQMQKFQDFILQQVHFSSDHKQKLSGFFKQIRGQFSRAQPKHHRVKSIQLKKQISQQKK